MRCALMTALVTALVAAGCTAQEVEPRPVEHRPDPVAATSSSAVEYRVSFPERSAGYATVEGVFPTAGRKELVIMMPVWTPGSYLVREFARNVHDLEARSGKGARLEAVKVAKNRWRIALDGSDHAAVRYRSYARIAGVRENFVDRDLAVLNGAATFFADAEHLDRTYTVEVALPEEWKGVVSSMPSREGRFVADGFDVLVDSPIVAGNPSVHRFEVGGVEHLLVNSDEGGVWDGPRSAKDVESIAREMSRFWGVIPYPRYVFFNVINEARGGLEHKNSTLVMTSRWKTRKEEDYRGWLGTMSHEQFHAWNGKRLRPQMLGPFDYEREVYTTDLWIVEGLTSYYDDLLLVRASLVTEEQYLTELSKQIESLQLTAGRKHDSLAAASFDAWIEFYRWDENSNNVALNYYTKGAVVGFLLDALIRRETNDAQSLDHVLREAYRRYSGERGYTSAEFYSVVEELGGRALRGRLARMVETTEELDYEPALDWYGLTFEAPGEGKDKSEKEKAEKPYLGLKSEIQNGRNVVVEVIDGGPAFAAGINAGDEVLAIDRYRVEDLAAHVERYRAKDLVTVMVSRRGVISELAVTLEDKPRTWKLMPAKNRSATQIRRFQRLLAAD